MPDEREVVTIDRKEAAKLIHSPGDSLFSVFFWEKPREVVASDYVACGMAEGSAVPEEQLPKFFMGTNKYGTLTSMVMMYVYLEKRGQQIKTLAVRELRKMNCRKGVRVHKDPETGEKVGLTGVGMAYEAEDYGLETVFDVQKQGYRHINVYTITELRIDKKICKVREAHLDDGTMKPSTTVDLKKLKALKKYEVAVAADQGAGA